jgi:RNA polymerase sigma factor (sigma-70 family)
MPRMASDYAESARAGDPVALEALLRERRTQVIRYAMRLCISPADAEDATQETLIALSRYIGSLREVAALSSWLFAAVRTHCMRLARRSLRHALDSDETPLSIEGSSPEDQLVDRQLRERLAKVVSELDADLREALVRRDILDQSAESAAQELGITLTALKSRLHRARLEARRLLLTSITDGQRKNAGDKSIFRILG